MDYEPELNDTYECDYCFKPCKDKEELRFHKCTAFENHFYFDYPGEKSLD